MLDSRHLDYPVPRHLPEQPEIAWLETAKPRPPICWSPPSTRNEMTQSLILAYQPGPRRAEHRFASFTPDYCPPAKWPSAKTHNPPARVFSSGPASHMPDTRPWNCAPNSPSQTAPDTRCAAPRTCRWFVAGFESGLLVRDFAFQLEDALGTPDQTEYLFHFHAPNRFKKTLADRVDLC